MIGTPGGVNGVSANAIAAPRTAACLARADVSCGTRSARNKAGNAASSPSFAGSPIASPNTAPRVVPPTHARYSVRPAPKQDAHVVASAALGGDRP